MKLVVVYNDGWNSRQSTFDNADTFDLDEHGNLMLLKNDMATPVALFAAGTWSNVFEL